MCIIIEIKSQIPLSFSIMKWQSLTPVSYIIQYRW